MMPLWAHYLDLCERIGIYYRVNINENEGLFVIEHGTKTGFRRVGKFRNIDSLSLFFQGVAAYYSDVDNAPNIENDEFMEFLKCYPEKYTPRYNCFTNRERAAYAAVIKNAEYIEKEK